VVSADQIITLNVTWDDLNDAFEVVPFFQSLLKRGSQLHKTEYDYYDERDSQSALAERLDMAT
jgi:hypothetical protein